MGSTTRKGRRPDYPRFGGVTRFAVLCALVVTPFAMFCWILPFVSRTTIGNDYPLYSPGAQIDLMWSVWKGTFPLYMPGFADGHSAAAMTLGQLYHPLSWVSSVMPGYWRGLALEWNSLFRLLSLGLAHLVLFKLCLRLCIAPLPAFLSTFPAIYNLRMLDSFRYGAALEGYVGMLLVASAAGFVFVDQTARRPVAFLALSTYMLAVSGHPQFAYLGLLVSGFFALLVPWIAVASQPGLRVSSTRLLQYGTRIAIGIGSGVLLASPYLLTLYFEFVRTNPARAERPYGWTLGYADTWRGEISNFLFPLHADVHSAFGGSALVLIVALFPLAALVKKAPRVLWILYGIGVTAFLFSLGRETPVHSFVVQHVPLFHSFRAPGRIVMWIPLVGLPISAWMLSVSNRAALVTAGTAGLAAFAASFVWTGLPVVESCSPHKLDVVPAGLDDLIRYLLAATLLWLTCSGIFQRSSRTLLALATVCMIGTTWLCLFSGTWKQDKRATATFAQIANARASSPASNADPGFDMQVRGVFEYRVRDIHPYRELGTIMHRVEQANSESEVFRLLETRARDLPLLLDGPVAPISEEVISDHDDVRLVYNTSNRFAFDLLAAQDGYFVLGLPWLSGFMCSLDGVAVSVAKSNALYPSVFVPRGTHHLDCRFVSRPFFAGMALSFVTVCVWITVSCRHWLSAVSAVLLCAALACLLYLSLYHGPSFGTNYHWQRHLWVGSTRPLTLEFFSSQ